MHLEGFDRDAAKNKSDIVPSPHELRKLEMKRMEEHHKGHEAMHFEMLVIFIVTIIVAQALLIEWRKRYPRSYQLVTLGGMWLIPVGVSLGNRWWRFIFSWLLFSGVTVHIVRRALERPTRGTTPRLVYKWFYFINKLSYFLGILGYVLFLISFFELNTVVGIGTQTMVDSSLTVIFYGLYYGVLGQDIAEISTDTMTSHIGYYSKDGLPSRRLDDNVCAVCDNRVLVSSSEEGVFERTYQLSCGHLFHEFCIRGWCIVGKKQTCPYCNEKVDYRKLFCNPWEKPHVIYGSLLELLRVLVTWQPVIFGLVQAINYILGLE